MTGLRNRWVALTAMAVCLVVIGLDSTVLNVALPTIAVDLHADTSQLQWFADAYLLVLAALMLPFGTLADRIGRKRLTLGALLVFGAGSAWCALAGGSGSLIGGRVLLGVGAAALMPLALSAVVAWFEPAERARAIGVVSIAIMIGLPGGPLVGGVLLDHFWWGSAFLINVPVVAAALVAVVLFVPADEAVRRERVDLVGIGASSVGLVALTFGLIEGPELGWSSPEVITALALAVVMLLAFVRWEARATLRSPVMDLSLWHDASFRWGTLGATASSFAVFGILFVLPQFFRSVSGLDALGAGVRTLPILIGMVGGVQLGSRVAGRLRAGRTCAVGFMLFAAALAWGSLTTSGASWLWLSAWTLVAGFGAGVSLVYAQSAAVSSLSRSSAGAGSALLQTMRQVGSVTGIASLGAVLNAVYRGHVDAGRLSGTAGQAVHDSVAGGVTAGVRAGLPSVVASARDAFTDGMHVVLLVSAGVCVLAALAMWLRLPHGSAHTPESRHAAAPPARESDGTGTDAISAPEFDPVV